MELLSFVYLLKTGPFGQNVWQLFTVCSINVVPLSTDYFLQLVGVANYFLTSLNLHKYLYVLHRVKIWRINRLKIFNFLCCVCWSIIASCLLFQPYNLSRFGSGSLYNIFLYSSLINLPKPNKENIPKPYFQHLHVSQHPGYNLPPDLQRQHFVLSV